MKRQDQARDISRTDAQATRYLDGELSPDEAASFESRIDKHADVQRALERASRLGELLRDTYRTELSAVDFSDFWASVEAGITEAVPVSSRRPASVSAGIRARLLSWLGATAWRPVAVGAIATAVLVSVLVPSLWVQQPTGGPFVANHDTYIQDGVVVEAQPDDTLAGEGETVVASNDRVLNTAGVEVSTVSEGASVYVVNGATIIWVSDEGDAEGAAI